jgi:hypothetical protein
MFSTTRQALKNLLFLPGLFLQQEGLFYLQRFLQSTAIFEISKTQRFPRVYLQEEPFSAFATSSTR